MSGVAKTRRIGDCSKMIEAAQIRAARALLAWRQEDVVRAAKVGLTTIRRIERQQGSPVGQISTLLRIQEALERAGVRFIENDDLGGIGVRLRRGHSKQQS